MALRMAKLVRTKSGLWTARKVIPVDVRTAYGKREEKPTWPATLTHGQARAEFGAWLTKIEEKIAALRSSKGGPQIDLTERQSRALAGTWYTAMVAREGDNPGDPLGWEAALVHLYPEEDEVSYQAYLRGNQEPYDGPWRPTEFLIGERDALLVSKGLHITARSSEQLVQDMADFFVSFCHLMIRRAAGDYGADPLTATLPAWEGAKVSAEVEATAGPTIMDLFDGYVAEEKPSQATVKAWKPLLQHLADFLGHDDASRVTADDVIRWKDHLLKEPVRGGMPRAARTVRDKYVASAKAVFNWAKRNRKIADNPVAGVVVGGRKPQKLRTKGLTDNEAAIILKATLQPLTEALTLHHAAARRWVPWLCAYAGARVNEMTQLRKEDIICESSVWAIRITPEAGSVKTNAARNVPLHSHLIDQGFLDFVQASADGPLFYDPKRHRSGSGGKPQYNKVGERLAEWVRKLGVDDINVAPNHGWRHRFKTVARQSGIESEARDMIQGHAVVTEGQDYGDWPLDVLSREIERLPRYQV